MTIRESKYVDYGLFRMFLTDHKQIEDLDQYNLIEFFNDEKNKFGVFMLDDSEITEKTINVFWSYNWSYKDKEKFIIKSNNFNEFLKQISLNKVFPDLDRINISDDGLFEIINSDKIINDFKVINLDSECSLDNLRDKQNEDLKLWIDENGNVFSGEQAVILNMIFGKIESKMENAFSSYNSFISCVLKMSNYEFLDLTLRTKLSKLSKISENTLNNLSENDWFNSMDENHVIEMIKPLFEKNKDFDKESLDLFWDQVSDVFVAEIFGAIYDKTCSNKNPNETFDIHAQFDQNIYNVEKDVKIPSKKNNTIYIVVGVSAVVLLIGAAYFIYKSNK